MNWYKNIKFSQSQRIAWIDKDGNTIPYIRNDHRKSLIDYYDTGYDNDGYNLIYNCKFAYKLINENKLIRVYVYGGTANFSLSFEGITPVQKEVMLDILVDNNTYNGFIETFKGTFQFNSFKKFRRILQTL